MQKKAQKIYQYITFTMVISSIVISSVLAQSSPIELTHLQTLANSSGMTDIAWSFNGKYLASADREGQIYIWDSETWSLVTNFDCEPYLKEGLSWSTSQSILGVGCSNFGSLVQSISINSDLTVVKFETFNQAVAWSPDGSWIAVPQENGTIGILDSSYNVIYALGEPYIPSPPSEPPQTDSGGVAYIGFKWSPTGEYLASIEIGQFTSITIWDVQTQQPIQRVDFAYDIIWSPDGDTFTLAVRDMSQLAASTLQSWTLLPPQMTTSVSVSNWPAYNVGGGSDNQYVAYCDTGNQLYFYDIANSQEVLLQSSVPIPCLINDIAWSSDSLLAIADADKVSIWGVQIPDACTITANTPAELITAIQTANGTPEADTICLAQNGMYTFTSAHASLKALPSITSDIKIIGNGATLARQAGSPAFRFFEVASNGTLTLENLTLSGAEANAEPGGAILNTGNLTVNNVTFSGNHAGTGAAIDNHRFGGTSNPITATITNSTFQNNTATYGAALDNDANATMTVTNSTFTGNVAVHDGGVIDNDSTATFTNSTFTANAAGRYGGAFETNGNLTLNGGTFSNNTAAQGGAVRNTSGLTVTGTTFENNTGATGGGYEGWGGAIFNISTGNGTVIGAIFSQNGAVNGGAIRNHGVLSLTDSQILNNTASAGGSGIFSTGSTTAHNSCISGNTASVTSVVHVGSNVQDFAGNYWGAADGPSGAGTGSGDSVNHNINYANFLTAGCPILSQ